MNVKDLIKRESLVKEATTYRVGSDNIEFEKKYIEMLKEVTENGIEDIATNIEKILLKKGKKISWEEAKKEARSFAKNYLKGVYGKASWS